MVTPMSATARASVSAVAELLEMSGSTPTKVAVALALMVPGTNACAVRDTVAEAPLASDGIVQVVGITRIAQVPAELVAADTLAPVTGMLRLTAPALGPALRTVTLYV